jgi:hypothetical protein
VLLLDVATATVGAAIVAGTVLSAVRTVVVPRGTSSVLTGLVFASMRAVFRVLTPRRRGFASRDRLLALYAPFSLLALPVAWLTLVLVGYALVYRSLGDTSLREAVRLSGSALLTLGFADPGNLPATVLVFTEAAVGIGLLALVITYLPTIYGVFARREAAVALLETRAGSPPSGVELIVRYQRIGWPGGYDNVWRDWQQWFADVEESHLSIPALVFFRSPQPKRSWVTAAGAVLDAASLGTSTVEDDFDAEAQLLIRSGYLALREVADYFGIPFDPDPAPDDPISITRDDYDAAYDRMAAEGVRVRADRDQAWRDFAGWRVNYDAALVGLAAFVDAPQAPWSSDRPPLPVAGRLRPRGLGG